MGTTALPVGTLRPYNSTTAADALKTLIVVPPLYLLAIQGEQEFTGPANKLARSEFPNLLRLPALAGAVRDRGPCRDRRAEEHPVRTPCDDCVLIMPPAGSGPGSRRCVSAGSSTDAGDGAPGDERRRSRPSCMR
jgi:hypothetical protein